jgi:hypothetical protein
MAFSLWRFVVFLTGVAPAHRQFVKAILRMPETEESGRAKHGNIIDR